MCNSKKCQSKFTNENPKGVIYTNTAIGFEQLNPEILKHQKGELLVIFGQKEETKEESSKNEKTKELTTFELYLKLKEENKDDPAFNSFYMGL